MRTGESRTIHNSDRTVTIEFDVVTFEVWEWNDYPDIPKIDGWMRHESHDTLEEALDWIDEGGWEYEPILEIREIESVESIEERDEPEFEYC